MTPTPEEVRAEVLTALANFVEDLREISKQTYEPHRSALWDIVTFLRGPDCSSKMAIQDNELLKIYTVARVRSIIGIPSAIGAILRSSPLGAIQRADRQRLLDLADEHFRVHWRNAARAIKLLYHYDLETEQPVPDTTLQTLITELAQAQNSFYAAREQMEKAQKAVNSYSMSPAVTGTSIQTKIKVV